MEQAIIQHSKDHEGLSYDRTDVMTGMLLGNALCVAKSLAAGHDNVRAHAHTCMKGDLDRREWSAQAALS